MFWLCEKLKMKISVVHVINIPLQNTEFEVKEIRTPVNTSAIRSWEELTSPTIGHMFRELYISIR